MAANDYYGNSHPGQSNDRNDAPLPPVPGNHTQHSVSPVSSPFDDRPYPTHTASSGALGGYPKRRKSKKKKGWFSGRVTWVVYLLTAVQVGVFVGELIKNGMLLQYKHIWRRRH